MTLRAHLFLLALFILSHTSNVFASGTLTIAINSLPTTAANTVTCTIGTSTGTCPGFFQTTTTITLKANTASGWNFDNWGAACAGTSTSCVLTVGDSSKGVTANFSWPTITIVRTGDGTGVVNQQTDSFPVPIACGSSCTTRRPRNEQVQLRASGETGVFASWSGCPGPSGTNCIFTMDKSIQVTAKFQKPKITVTKQGTGAAAGVVTSTAAGINCGSVCSASFPAPLGVDLVGTPASGDIAVFTCGLGTSFKDCLVQCNLNQDCVLNTPVTVTFRHPQLTVVDFGTGTGAVVSNPSGINCSAGTCTGSFLAEQGVDLTATPSAGMVFSGYTVSDGGRPVTSTTCSRNALCHLVLANDMRVSAHFSNYLHLQLTVQGSGSITSSSS